ncbi:MAG: hypothetical protein KBT11_03765 [Treponema sp.]|nr:hypothetical protein [Candidatus Treponema equifaecale]
MIVKNITDKISYIPSSEDPFTADVALIKQTIVSGFLMLEQQMKSLIT